MNQRRHVRHIVKPRLYVTLSGSNAGGILHDISDDGVALDIVDLKPCEQRVLLDFDMSETGDRFEGLGRIIWENESASRIGIQFVDLPDASRNKVRDWLSVKSSARDTLQNMEVRDRGESPSMDTPPQRSSARAASAVLERRQKEQAVIDGAGDRPPQKMEFEPVLPSRDNADGPPPQKEDRPVTDSQVSFSRTGHDEPIPSLGVPLRSVSADRNAYTWKGLKRLVLIVTIICIAISVAVVIKVVSTGRTPPSVKSFVANSVNSSARVRVPSPKLSTSARNRAPHQAVSDTITDLNTGKPIAADQFEVMDAQHGRRYFPRTGTNVAIQTDQSLATEPASTISPLFDASKAKTGRVSQQFSGELPVVETIPEYPTFALQTNVEGRVVLNATVGTDGTLRNEHLVSSPSMLDATVLDAVKKWRYHPHLEKGKPVEVETQITVEFSITTQ